MLSSSHTRTTKYVIDTNFFISGFEKNPKSITRFINIITENGFEIYVTNLIISELRWYLRRHIKSPIKVYSVDMKKIRKLRSQLERDGIISPTVEDLSNIEAANSLNATIVTSDLHLLRVCEKLDIPAIISSSFVYLLLSIVNDSLSREFLYKLYDIILSDEISYSISQQEEHDPIIRIKKIQEHALTVIKQLSQQVVYTSQNELQTVRLLPEEARLIDFINQIEFEFPNYLSVIENGDYEAIHTELLEIYKELIDITSELRVALQSETSVVLDVATRLKARILFLLCVVEFNILDLNLLSKNLDILTELSITHSNLIADLYMDIHFLRMIYFVIIENPERLQHYYSEKFILLCETEQRYDLIRLTRVVVLASTILESGLIDKQASVPGKDEVALLQQIGYIMLQLQKFEQAMLLLYQTLYYSFSLKDMQSAKDTLSLLIVLNYAIGESYSLELHNAISELKKLGAYDYPHIEKPTNSFVKQCETDDFIDIEKLSSYFREWFYIYKYVTLGENQSPASVLLIKNPYFEPKVALVSNKKFSPHEVLPGRQIKMYDGKIKITANIPEPYTKLNIDMLILVEDETKIVCRGTFGLKLLH